MKNNVSDDELIGVTGSQDIRNFRKSLFDNKNIQPDEKNNYFCLELNEIKPEIKKDKLLPAYDANSNSNSIAITNSKPNPVTLESDIYTKQATRQITFESFNEEPKNEEYNSDYESVEEDECVEEDEYENYQEEPQVIYTQETQQSSEQNPYSLKIFVESFEVTYKLCDDFGLLFNPYIDIITPSENNSIHLSSYNNMDNSQSQTQLTERSDFNSSPNQSMNLSGLCSFIEGDSIERTYYYREVSKHKYSS